MVHLLDGILTMNHAYVNQDTSYKCNAMHYKGESRHAELHYMGSMTNECMHCGTLILKTLNAAIMVKLCCYLEELKCLLVGTTDRDKHFQMNIRYYNSSFTFASMGTALFQLPGSDPLCFRICGQIFHHYERPHSQIHLHN